MMRLGTVFAVSLVLSGCAPGLASLQSRKAEVKSIEKSISQAKARLDVHDRYIRALQTGEGQWIALSAAEILDAMKQYAPYRFKGSDLSKKRLKGTLWFTQPSRVTFHPDNRVTYRTKLGAKKIEVNLKGVFGASQSDARKIKDAIEGGGYADIEVRARIDRKKGEVLLFGHCYDVKLNRHDTRDHRKYLKDGINSKFFKYGKRIPLPKNIAAARPHLLSTPHHFVVIGR